jgi:hypothetical protein
MGDTGKERAATPAPAAGDAAPDRPFEAMARSAGLETALAHFADDIAAAAQQARDLRRLVRSASLAPADEPWAPPPVPAPR